MVTTRYSNRISKKCIVHKIRNSIKYIASKDKKSFMKDLKEVYKATTEKFMFAQLYKLKNLGK